MTNDARLYIGGQLIEFNEPPAIFFTYQVDDCTNPTVVLNDFTRQLVIDGSANNNRIFDHFWRPDRQTNQGFNPTQPVEFELYNGVEMYERGYVKLDEVKRTGERIQYYVTLYGGLGSFLSNLTWDNEGNKLKLSDLVYENEPAFTINADTVYEAWTNIGNSGHSASTVNFAPCYNGTPDAIDAGTVMVDVASTDLEATVVKEGQTFNAYNGYGVVKLDESLTEWEVKDLRSYLQRPVLRVKEVIKACVASGNNGGYEVELDPTFFNSGNTEWEDTWMTLPLLTEIEYNPAEDATGTVSLSQSGGTEYVQDYELNITANVPINSFRLSFDLTAGAGNETRYVTATNLYSNIFIQMIGYDEDGDPITASNLKNLAGEYIHPGVDKFRGTSEYGADNVPISYLDKPVDLIKGRFEPINGILTWVCNNGEPIELEMLNVENVVEVALVIRRCGYSEDKRWGGYNRKQLRRAVYDGSIERNPTLVDVVPTNLEIKITQNTPDGIRSNSEITKEMLLNTEYTPCDFLLSYCKTYGLHLLKEPCTNHISILTRDSFYRNRTVDVTQLIDRGSEILISPLVADSRWYDFKLEEVDGQYAQEYRNTTDVQYGMKRLDTNYTFNRDHKDLFAGNTFRSAIECLEKSRFYTTNSGTPAYFGNIFKYGLYNGSEKYEVEVGKSYDVTGLSPYKYYDNLPKVQLHSEGNGAVEGDRVLLYYRGKRALMDNAGNPFTYSLSDDKTEMMAVADGEYCWLYTTDSMKARQMSWLPSFGRYITAEDGTVEKSLDFGQPRQLYVKQYGINDATEDSTEYNRYWKRYCEDLYDKDTRIVEVNMLIKPVMNAVGQWILDWKPNPEWLRNFYWFDNTLWRLQGIYEYNPADEDLTRCRFVKVQDMQNYTSDLTPDTPTVKVNRLVVTPSATSVAPNGGQITLTVDANMSWSASTDLGTLSVSAGTGNTTTTSGDVTTTLYDTVVLTIPNYYTGSEYSPARTATVTFTGAVSGYTVEVPITQDVWNPSISLSPDYILLEYTGGVRSVSINKRDCPNAVVMFNPSDEDYYWVVDGDGVEILNYGLTGANKWNPQAFFAFGGNRSDLITSSNGVFKFTGVTSSVIEVPFAVVCLPEYFTVNRQGKSTVTNDDLTLELQFDDKVEVVSYPQWVMILPFSEWNAMTEEEQALKRAEIAAFIGSSNFSLPESAGQVKVYCKPLPEGTRVGNRSNLLTFFDGNQQIAVELIQRGSGRRGAPEYEGDYSEDYMTGDTTTYVLNGTDICFDGTGESHYVNLIGGTGYTVEVEYTRGKYNTTNWSDDWLTVDTAISATQLYITAKPNFECWSGSTPPTYMPRIAYIHIINANTEETIVCRQWAMRASMGGDYLIIDESGFDPAPSGTPTTSTLYKTVAPTGETFSFQYQSSDPITVSASDSWITYVYDSGGSGTISITVPENDVDDRQGTITISNGVDTRIIILTQAYDSTDYSTQYFTIESLDDNNTFHFWSNVADISELGELYYSLDSGSTWNRWYYTNPTIDSGETIYLKRTSDSRIGQLVGTSGGSTGRFIVYGNANSLFKGDDFETVGTLPTSGLSNMFGGCTNLLSAKGMVLPWSTLSTACYSSMFSSCASLEKGPRLTATTLADYCYGYMFSHCTSLTTAPVLPATTLAKECYHHMFYGCTSITTAPVLPATTLANSCYSAMFAGCTSLTTAPDLPATTLPPVCYSEMFEGCTSLVNPPSMSATGFSFDPALLSGYSYSCYWMFRDCTSLTTAPVLYAATLAENCYLGMFDTCTSLTGVTCLATDISARNCTSVWLYDVPSSGTFTKAASMNDWPRNNGGIPSGWTVQDYTP